MNQNLTEMVFILDRSGSMAGLESDTIGGFNAMLEKQKQEAGEALVSTILFDDYSKVIHDRTALEKIAPMTDKDYYVRGCTALLDALGGAIHHIATVHRYAREEDRPAKTIFVITTDGLENASQRYTVEKVRQMVRLEQEKYGWEFLFLGANMDAIGAAKEYGIREDHAVRYQCDGEGTNLNFETVSVAVGSIRCGKKLDKSWKRNIEEDFKKRGGK